MKQVVGLMSNSGRPSLASSQGPPSASLAVQATVSTPAPPTLPSVPAQEVFVYPPTVATVSVPLVALGVMTVSALNILPSSSSASPVPTLTILTLMLPSSSSCLNVSLHHVYTSHNTGLMWSMGYRMEQGTLTNFVSSYNKNLIRLVGVQNATDSVKVFI